MPIIIQMLSDAATGYQITTVYVTQHQTLVAAALSNVPLDVGEVGGIFVCEKEPTGNDISTAGKLCFLATGQISGYDGILTWEGRIKGPFYLAARINHTTAYPHTFMAVIE